MTKSPHPSSVDKGELLPVTQAEECDAAGYTKSMRELLDSLGGYQNVFNAIADATSVYAEGVGVNIGVRAFIRSITPHRQAHSLPGDVGMREAAFASFVLRCSAANPASTVPKSEAIELLERFGIAPRDHGLFFHSQDADEADARDALTPSALSGDAGEPVAYLHSHPDHGDELELYRHGASALTDADRAAGWTETELFARAAHQGAGE